MINVVTECLCTKLQMKISILTSIHTSNDLILIVIRLWGSSPKSRFGHYFGELKFLRGNCLITHSIMILVNSYNNIMNQNDDIYPKMQ